MRVSVTSALCWVQQFTTGKSQFFTCFHSSALQWLTWTARERRRLLESEQNLCAVLSVMPFIQWNWSYVWDELHRIAGQFTTLFSLRPCPLRPLSFPTIWSARCDIPCQVNDHASMHLGLKMSIQGFQPWAEVTSYIDTYTCTVNNQSC